MICLVKNNTIVLGPASWDFRAILEHLIVAGFDLMEGTLYGPDKSAVCFFTDIEPQAPLALHEFMLLPAIEVDEPAPEGKMLAGREPVILEDRVELRPVWADIIVPPAQPAPAPQVEFTKLGFLARFTDEEKVLLKSLESTDPTVALFWEEYRTADSIRLDDPRVIRGLTYLAAQGHITEARKLEILEGA